MRRLPINARGGGVCIPALRDGACRSAVSISHGAAALGGSWPLYTWSRAVEVVGGAAPGLADLHGVESAGVEF